MCARREVEWRLLSATFQASSRADDLRRACGESSDGRSGESCDQEPFATACVSDKGQDRL